METSTEDIHPHCLQCVKFSKCTVMSKPGESCNIISCPAECGAKFHACKRREHRLLCMNEKVSCINSEYGCPAMMFRKYQSRHLTTCPASIIHCSEEWDRWPIHFHDNKKPRNPSQLDPTVHNHLDVALAMRDQRMLRRWCVAAAQGHSLNDHKFMISPSSSLWVFRKWQSSREYSYPPGLEQSVCNELCKTCKKNGNVTSNVLPHNDSNMSHTDKTFDTYCMDFNGVADKENCGDINNKKQENTQCVPLNKQKMEKHCSSQENLAHSLNNKHELPQYNLDDVLQLSQFGSIVYYQSSGEGSIRVAIDPSDCFANSCSDHQNVACQILDFKFRNPSSTPPWCLSLGLDLNLESRSQHPPSNFMYTFLCCQEFRRDQYGWHYKNVHSEIHGGLNGWLIERCPLAQYGCMFARKRFNPAPQNSCIVYNEILESFGVACTPAQKDKSGSVNSCSPRHHSGQYALNLTDLPFDVLQHIVQFLDSFSLANLSLVSSLLRDVCSTVLKDHGLVRLKWERHKKDDKYTWQLSKSKRWFFSSHFTPVHKWTFDEQNNMSNHLKTCPYFNRIAQKRAFGYADGPHNVHPKPDKRYSDPLKELCENSTTKL